MNDPGSLFRRAFARSFTGHLVVLGLALGFPVIRGLFEHELPAGSPFYVDLASSLPPGPPPAPVEEAVEEQKEPEQEEVIPMPVKTEIKKPDEKKAEEKKPDDKKKIKLSTNKVIRAEVKTAAKPPAKAPSRAEIEKMLSSGIAGTGGGGGTPGLGGTGTGPLTEMDEYFVYVFNIMYEAWNQPSDLAGSRISSSVRIRVQRDGTIAARDMVRPSGNAVMDDSVMKAVRGVPHLRRLPASFSGSYKDITIDFQLTAEI
jgi:outer membrane biosynthesis protein TonB